MQPDCTFFRLSIAQPRDFVWKTPGAATYTGHKRPIPPFPTEAQREGGWLTLHGVSQCRWRGIRAGEAQRKKKLVHPIGVERRRTSRCGNCFYLANSLEQRHGLIFNANISVLPNVGIRLYSCSRSGLPQTEKVIVSVVHLPYVHITRECS